MTEKSLNPDLQQRLAKFSDDPCPTHAQAMELLQEVSLAPLLEFLKSSSDTDEIDVLLNVIERLCRFPDLERALLDVESVPHLLDAGSYSPYASVRVFLAKMLRRVSATQEPSWFSRLGKGVTSSCCVLAMDSEPGAAENAVEALAAMIQSKVASLSEVIGLLNCFPREVRNRAPQQFAACAVRLATLSPEAFTEVNAGGLLSIFPDVLLSSAQESDFLVQTVVLELLYELIQTPEAIGWMADPDVGLLQHFAMFLRGRSSKEHPLECSMLLVVERIIEFGPCDVVSSVLKNDAGARVMDILCDPSQACDEIRRLSALRLFSCLLRTQRHAFIEEFPNSLIEVSEIAFSTTIATSLRNVALAALQSGLEGTTDEVKELEAPINAYVVPKLIKALKASGSRIDSRPHMFYLAASIFRAFPNVARLCCSDFTFAHCLTDESVKEVAVRRAQQTAARSLRESVPPLCISAILGVQYLDRLDAFCSTHVI